MASYLSDFLCPISTVVLRRRLHSAAWGDHVIDTSVSDFGQHSFSVTAPRAWNELLDSLQNIRTVDSFKWTLKTFQFNSLTTCHHRHPRSCNGHHVQHVRNCQFIISIIIICPKLWNEKNFTAACQLCVQHDGCVMQHIAPICVLRIVFWEYNRKVKNGIG